MHCRKFTINMYIPFPFLWIEYLIFLFMGQLIAASIGGWQPKQTVTWRPMVTWPILKKYWEDALKYRKAAKRIAPWSALLCGGFIFVESLPSSYSCPPPKLKTVQPHPLTQVVTLEVLAYLRNKLTIRIVPQRKFCLG